MDCVTGFSFSTCSFLGFYYKKKTPRIDDLHNSTGKYKFFCVLFFSSQLFVTRFCSQRETMILSARMSPSAFSISLFQLFYFQNYSTTQKRQMKTRDFNNTFLFTQNNNTRTVIFDIV